MNKEKWKKKIIQSLKAEAERLIERINEVEEEDYNALVSYKIAAVKRASLDLNREGAKLRNGFYKTFKSNKKIIY